MLTSSRFAFVQLVMAAVESYDEHYHECCSYALDHRDDDYLESDYQTGQSFVVVGPQQVLGPEHAVIAKACQMVRSGGFSDWRKEFTLPTNPTPFQVGQLVHRLSVTAMRVAKPIYEQFRNRTTWDETILQWDREIIPLVTKRAQIAYQAL